MLNGSAMTLHHRKQADRHGIVMAELFDLRARLCPRFTGILISAACALALPAAAQARDIFVTAPATDTETSVQQPLTPEESDLLSRVLTFDAAASPDALPARTPSRPGLAQPQPLSVQGSEKSDGSRSVAVKQPFGTGEIDASVGADLNTAASLPDTVQPNAPLPGAIDGQGSASVWASIGLPNLASIDVRAGSANAQGQVGTTFKHAFPIGERLSVTMQDRVSATRSYDTMATDPSMAAGLPLTATPTPVAPSALDPGPVFGNERSLAFNYKPTGTTLAATSSSASNDPLTHHTLSADQQLIGPLHVTTAVTDPGEPTASKSITAGFQLQW
jgi:hypothetical protein